VRRRIFFLASLLSLLMCMGATALWVRSSLFLETWTVDGSAGGSIQFTVMEVSSAQGKLALLWCSYPPRTTPPVRYSHYSRQTGARLPQMERWALSSPQQRQWVWHFPGFRFYVREPLREPKAQFTTDGGPLGPPAPGVAEPEVRTIMVVKSVGGSSLTLSYWLLTFVFAALPSVWIVRLGRRLRRLRAAGCCGTCGYNLTGNTSGTCPECGTAVPQTSRPA
jgi:hypothetical protein